MNQHTDFVNNLMRSMQRSTNPYSEENPAYPKVVPKSQHMQRKKHQHSFTVARNAAPAPGMCRPLPWLWLPASFNYVFVPGSENCKSNEAHRRQQQSSNECADSAKSV